MALRSEGKSSAKKAAAAARKRSKAARQGWETRRAREEAAKKKRAAQAAARAARAKAKAEAHARRVAAGKKGARRRKARERAEAAFATWEENAGQRDARGTFIRETKRLHESWLQAKRELYDALDEDYEAYMGILEDIAEASGTEWDIAYGPDGEAAA